ncbi:hypothetical protein [Paraburkholderia silvatlantica]|uniref:Uncharacterized protein n=1 Tax=Paraburkholderia silvatlantica TaxID=321895 RepID=A0A2U0ZX55_9BURK|nr:hypothetical protein [Paraburkholderia silvatlantica]MBB2928497.1 hypothetical protein [Paraburkholderia silvatlantica]PVY23622.1 hypothetical protein C7411_128109 [Paraburkholderia silvatlantica]PXW30860.1 hypothetical protein C7413_127109 [Paraburkholderia silvatlantica]PYE13860.1 hypothetical protein C7410_1428 [Paraburkholderia silvatlantica]
MEVLTQAQRPPRAAVKRGSATRTPGWIVAAVAAAVVLTLPFAARAQDAGAQPPVKSTLKPNPGFATLPQYVGTLGKRQIVMRLGAKAGDDDPTGVHGEYQFTDTGEVILIAGDRADATLEAEDSNDGTHITGNWVGTFAEDGSLSGDRMDPDDSHPVPFDLKPLAAGAAAPAVPTGAAGASASTPNGARAVNGVSNLVIGQ